MAKRATTSDTDAPDTSQLGAEISRALATADTTAVERILELQRVRQARVAQLTRTAAALKAQYGASDASVMAAEANVAAATLTAARIGMAQRQAATPDPQVSANGWTLHGQVCDAKHQPMSGFTVFLADASHTYQQAYGFAYTDAVGNFQLNYAGPDPVEKDKSTKAASIPDLFVGVSNAKGELVRLSPTPFQPTAGAATYLNIMLLSGNESSVDPPAPIRDVAIPPKNKPSKKTRK
jgi:hypothetical protein